MRKRDYVISIIIIIALILIATNITGINDFLSFQSTETVTDGNTTIMVTDAFNKTIDTPLKADAHTNLSVTNGYVIFDVYGNWPEPTITSISNDSFSEMEGGNYKVLSTSTLQLDGRTVSKLVYDNPTANPDGGNHIGINYVFKKHDVNYCVNVHYVTSTDYNDTAFMADIDNMAGQVISSTHNANEDGWFSGVRQFWNFITNNN